MAQRKLLLFDWDKTIKDQHIPWPFENHTFRSLIKARQQSGWYIGLNSDTPYERLRNWYDRLEMNGPILAEKGLVIWFPDIDRPHSTEQTEGLFTEIRGRLIQRLSQHRHVTFYFGDNVGFVSTVNCIPPGRPIFVALDAYRVCSLGLIVREVDHNGQLQISSSATWDEICQLVTECLPEDSRIGNMDVSGRYAGFMGISTQDAVKEKGLAALYLQWPFDRIVMVGDSLSDYMNLHRALRKIPQSLTLEDSQVPQVEHFAVANAQETYYQQERVTLLNRPFLDGCIEALERIAP